MLLSSSQCEENGIEIDGVALLYVRCCSQEDRVAN